MEFGTLENLIIQILHPATSIPRFLVLCQMTADLEIATHLVGGR